MRTLSALYPRYGYRHIRIFLRRQGHSSACTAGTGYGVMRDCSCHEAGRAGASPPAVLGRWRRARQLRVGLRLRFDATAQGQQIKCFTVVDEFTHECLAIDVTGSIRSKRVIEVLSHLISTHGAPLFLRSDNGPEVVSRAIPEWSAESGIATALIDPGKPWQNRPARASTAASATSA